MIYEEGAGFTRARDWQKCYGSACLAQYLRKGAMVSIGMGKIVVEFLSAEISTRVWRYRSCKAAGFRLITSAASARRCEASNSPWAWMTFARRSRSASA